MKMSPSPNNGMGMMDDKSEMSMPPEKGVMTKGAMTAGPAVMGMKDDQSGMGGMPSKGTAAMRAKPLAAGGIATMSGPSSATPGQGGTPHLYHMGSRGFFLNQSRHITLSPDQNLTLNLMKKKAMLNRAFEQRNIDEAEQELYATTGAYQPDESRIEAKIVEIEKLHDQRISFIRAVAEASNVLTPEQRTALLGTTSATRNN